MQRPPVDRALRLTRFRPVAGVVHDVVLRERVVGPLLAAPGLVDLLVGRHGAEAGDDRVIASVWEHGADADVDEGALLESAGIELVGDVSLEVAPIRFGVAYSRDEPSRVLRVFHRQVRDGELERYVAAAHEGTLAHGEANPGLVSLYLAVTEPSRFVTVSAWTDWDAIARATGGDIRRPFATRHAHLLATHAADHFEIVPNIERPIGAGATLLAS